MSTALFAREFAAAADHKAEPELPTIRYAGAKPVTERLNEERFDVFAEPSAPDSRGVPNVTVFVLPSGRCSVATEKASTEAMGDAVDRHAIAAARKLKGTEVVGEGCAEMHREIVRLLRRDWAIGRIERKDGVWDYIAESGKGEAS
jgi:hypothetical protein